MPRIELSKRSKRQVKVYAEVDEVDFEFLNTWSWYNSRRCRGTNDQPVPRRSTRVNGKVVAIYLHRVIAERMGLDIKSNKVGHLDGNTLNNRRSNIGYKNGSSRTRSYEKTGVVSTVRNSVTGHPGITYNKHDGMYVARASNRAERITVKVGSFSTLELAIQERERFLETWDGYSAGSQVKRLHTA